MKNIVGLTRHNSNEDRTKPGVGLSDIFELRGDSFGLDRSQLLSLFLIFFPLSFFYSFNFQKTLIILYFAILFLFYDIE